MKRSDIRAQMRRDRDSKTLLDQARQYVFEDIEAVDERAVFPDENAIRNLDRFDEPMPERSQSGAGTLEMLNTYGAPATVAQTGGRYFGDLSGRGIENVQAVWIRKTDESAHKLILPCRSHSVAWCVR